MIYAASLAPYIKRAKIKGLTQATINDIRVKLPDDPRTSKMDVVAIAEKDITSLPGKRLLKEMSKRHEKIRIVYIYVSAENANLVQDGPGIHKCRLAKLSAETVGRVINKQIDDIDISQADKKVFYNDDDVEEEHEEKAKKSGLFNIFKSHKSEPKQKHKSSIFKGAGAKKGFNDEVLRKDEGDESHDGASASEYSSDIEELQKHALTDEEIEERNSDFRVGNDEAVIIESDDNQQSANPPMGETFEKEENKEDLELPNNEMPEPTVAPIAPKASMAQNMSFEKRLERLNLDDSIDFIQQAMSKEALSRELMTEDTEYAGCKYMLEQWDREMLTIARDTTMGAEEKIQRIRELAFKRTERKGTVNNKLMSKLSTIMHTTTEVCKKAVDEKVDELRRGLATVIDAQVVNASEEEMSKLIRERQELSVELREYLLSIVNIYKVMDVSVSELINAQSTDLPSANSFINDQFALEKELFVPQNASALTARILSDLRENLLQFSQMEGILQNLITSVFKLIDKDSAIIQEQEKRYQILKDVRVEETVTITNVLKNALRIFVGPDDAGVTATALTWAGLRSRRQNTLLIDLRGDDSKLQTYGETPMEIDEFFEQNLQRHFLVLKAKVETPMDMDELISKLTPKTNYYSSINLIFDDTQIGYVNRCVDNTLSVNVVCDSTINNINKTRVLMDDFSPINVGIKFVAIDPAVERLEFLQKLNIDQFVSQVIAIPYLKDMRQCAIRNEHPYERQVIADIFEEAFR